MLIETLDYRISYLHGRYMVENHINGYYDSFRRVRPAVLEAFAGDSFKAELGEEIFYILAASNSEASHTWTLIAFVGGVIVSEAPIAEAQVRELFAAMVISFDYREIGDDVETNYEHTLEYREAH